MRSRSSASMGNAAYARFAALWFGVQLVWGAVLAVSLQSRSTALAPSDALAAYSVIAALGALVGMVAQLASGPLADRYFERSGNRRIFYAAGVAIAVPALLWFYLASNYTQLLTAFFLLQLGMNIVGGPYAAIVPDYVPPGQAGSASAWMGTLQAVGNAGGLLVAAFVESRFAVACILAAALAATWLITSRATSTYRADRAPRQPLTVGRDFRTLLASRTAINFGFYTLLGFLFFFVAQSLHTPAAAVRTSTALLFLTFTLTNVAGAALAAKPADRFDKRAVVLTANVIVGAGLLLLALAPNAATAFAAAAIAGIGWGAYFIADWALAVTLLPRSAMASAMSVWNIAATLPQILAPVITTPLVKTANAALPGAGPRLAIGLAILEFTLGAVWLYRLPKR
jgi:MFS family permease